MTRAVQYSINAARGDTRERETLEEEDVFEFGCNRKCVVN